MLNIFIFLWYKNSLDQSRLFQNFWNISICMFFYAENDNEFCQVLAIEPTFKVIYKQKLNLFHF